MPSVEEQLEQGASVRPAVEVPQAAPGALASDTKPQPNLVPQILEQVLGKREVDTKQALKNIGVTPEEKVQLTPAGLTQGQVQPINLTTADYIEQGQKSPYFKGVNQEASALQQGAREAGQLAEEQVGAIKKFGVQEEELKKANQVFDENQARYQKIQELQTKAINDFQVISDKYVNTPVDKERVFKNMSTGARVLNALALVLGAFGATKDGQNAAAKMLNDEVDKDIALQSQEKASIGERLQQQKGLLAELQQALGSSTVAMNAAKAIQMDYMNQKLQQLAAKSNSMQAKQQAAVFAAKLQQQKDQFLLAAYQGAQQNAITQVSEQKKAVGQLLNYQSGDTFERKLQEMEMLGVPSDRINEIRKESQLVKNQLSSEKELSEAEGILKGKSAAGALIGEFSPIHTQSEEAINNANSKIEGAIASALKERGAEITKQNRKDILKPYLIRPLDSKQTISEKMSKVKEFISDTYKAKTPNIEGLGLRQFIPQAKTLNLGKAD